MMKRVIASVLFIMLFFTGCSSAVLTWNEMFPAETKPSVEPGKVEEVFDSTKVLVETDENNEVIHQYGESDSLVDYGETFACSISYPLSGIEAVDNTFKSSAHNFMRTYKAKDVKGVNELTVNYNSYMVKDLYAGVKQMGWFSNETEDHYEEIVNVVNIDLVSGNIIDIYEGKELESILSLLRSEVAKVDETAKIDEDWLKYSVLTHEGLEVVLPKGKYLDEEHGTAVFLLPYDKVQDFLAIDLERDPNAEPEPEDTEEPFVIDPEKPMIALTFDDGPSGYTEGVLDVFKEYGGHGTFCLVGNRINKNKDTVIRTAAEGHEIATHTWDHTNLTTVSGDEAASKMSEVENFVDDIVEGYDIKFLRPPYGSINGDVKAAARREGLAIATWSIDTLDWKTRNAEKTIATVKAEVQDGSIILFHDIYESTLEAVKVLIPYLINEGYQLVTLSELLYYKEGGAVPGTVYRHA